VYVFLKFMVEKSMIIELGLASNATKGSIIPLFIEFDGDLTRICPPPFQFTLTIGGDFDCD